MRLGTAPPLRARLLAPQIYRREPDPKARGDHRRRQTGRISQQHPLAQISRIGAWHHCLLQETNHSTHKQHTFQIHTESALMREPWPIPVGPGEGRLTEPTPATQSPRLPGSLCPKAALRGCAWVYPKLGR